MAAAKKKAAAVDQKALAERVQALRAQAATGKITASIVASGERLEVTFRKPTAREWQDYESVRTNYGVTVGAGTVNKELAREMYDASEELCVRVINSHTAEQLQALNEEHLGIFFELASEVGDAIDLLRAGSGKASPPPGGM